MTFTSKGSYVTKRGETFFGGRELRLHIGRLDVRFKLSETPLP